MDANETTSLKPSLQDRLGKSLRGALPWVLVTLISLGLGALIITVALYLPTRQKLDKTTTDLVQANATITAKTDQISTLQADNQTLQKGLESTTLHMYLLKAISGVRGASLAVAADDYAGARLSLIQTSDALDSLSGLLGADQKDILSAMQTSAAKALTDIKTDLKSAQPELVQLTKNLVQLKANLFPNP